MSFEIPGRGPFISILILIGALALFLYGMKVMSEGIQKAAGQRMRSVLQSMTSNQLRGITTGFITTGIIQSSSATSVMIVSFVNAGLLNLRQAFGVIMGANIGTTITSWLIVIFGFGKFDIYTLSLPVMAIGMPLLFSNKSVRKAIAEFLIGFALLFLGLEFLQESVPNLSQLPSVMNFIKDWSGEGFLFLLVAILIGTVITMIIQSSSAAMALTLILVSQGYISFEMAAGMVLGENIGTTITANLAALVGNTDSKRAALSHTIFNFSGVLWMIIVLPWFLKLIELTMVSGFGFVDPFADPRGQIIALSAFHTLFNLCNVLVLVGFTDPIINLTRRIFKSKNKDEEYHLKFIRSATISIPELAVLEAQKEVAHFGKITARMAEFSKQLLFEKEGAEKKKIYERIEKYEIITDRIEVEIGDYLAKVSETNLSESTMLHIRSMLSINGDLERVADIFFQMSKAIERKDNEKMWFTPEQRNNLAEMFILVEKSLTIMNENLDREFLKADLNKAMECEEQINAKRNELRSDYFEELEKTEHKIKSGIIYSDLFSSLEKVGDHVINVSEAMAGKI
ncbi:MAG: Na/Pi cotransporter family protein [Crocinitomicaceae bacterium]|nr:Na/Pi cotransporter family protein [Crocinitomicaceae bacterium]